MAESHVAYIGLGSNLGDSWTELLSAREALQCLPETVVDSCSAVYRSAPCDVGPQPDFLNAVCRIRTRLGPPALLEALLTIERARGRLRLQAGAPRTLDLDLLLYDALILNSPELVLPHPRMHVRAFVLQPLADLDPALIVPQQGAVGALLQHCRDQRIERLGPLPAVLREAWGP